MLRRSVALGLLSLFSAAVSACGVEVSGLDPVPVVPSTTSAPSAPTTPPAPPRPPPTPTPPPPPKPEGPCGAAEATKCEGGKACKSGDDCTSGVCTGGGVCLFARSCNRVHGGVTCGPEAKMEDCCTSIPIDVGGRRVNLDKYSITAGRMRTFVEATNGNVKGYIEANKPTWWDASWTAFLPRDFDGNYNVYDQLGPAPLYEQISEGSRTHGCYLNGYGARTYWIPPEMSELYGDIPQVYPKDVLDEKALNCASAVLIAALCAWDGGRLPSPAEIEAAWGNAKYPWGNAPAPWNFRYAPTGDRTYANHGDNYEFPETVGTDVSAHVAPPGRYPKGNGPFGHSDIVGNVWNFTTAVFRDGPYTPDPLNQWVQWTRGAAWESGQMVPFQNVRIQGEPGYYPVVRAPMLRKYWAAGGRCARTL